jgi:hypothetical protein
MKVTVVDSAMTRDVLRDISRRSVDISELEVHVMHGVVYLKGRISNMRGENEGLDLHKELEIIMRMLRIKSGVREIVNEVELGGPSIRERQSTHVKRETY